VGLEILEDVSDADVILVPCGGGALLAGVAAAVKLSGHSQCRIYGVEPQEGKLYLMQITMAYGKVFNSRGSINRGHDEVGKGTWIYIAP